MKVLMMEELFGSLRSGLAPEKAAHPCFGLLQISVLSFVYKRFTYFPFFYFLWLWEQDGEGRVERTYRSTSVFRKQNKAKQNPTCNSFSNVLLWDFVLFFQ